MSHLCERLARTLNTVERENMQIHQTVVTCEEQRQIDNYNAQSAIANTRLTVKSAERLLEDAVDALKIALDEDDQGRANLTTRIAMKRVQRAIAHLRCAANRSS